MAWTLAIEMVFYTVVLLSFPLRMMPILRVLFLLFFVFSVVIFSRDFGDRFFLFAATVSYLPFLAFGQIMYFCGHSKTMGAKTGVVLIFLSYFVIYWSLATIQPQFLVLNNSYLTNFVLALAIFFGAWKLGERAERSSALIKLLADSSYAVYLMHGFVGYFLLGILVPKVGIYYSLMMVLPIIFASSLLLHFFVEKPFLHLAKTLSEKVVVLLRAR